MDKSEDVNKKELKAFDEQISRKPNRYPWTEPFKKAMHDSFWTVNLFTFESDLHDFKVNLKDQEREMIVKSLSTIGQIEVSVKKFWAKLGENLPHPSLHDLGCVMANVEVIHGDAYERLLEVLGIEDAFDDILTLPIIQGRVNYLRKHLHKFHNDNKKQFIYSLILFTLFVENISLFSQFYTISYFGRFKNLLKDTNKQIEYTSREEDLHAKVGIMLINTLKKEYPELFDEELEKKILHESEQAVKYECEIVNWIINGYQSNCLSSEIVREFIKNRMNNSLVEIGYTPIFEVNKELVDKTKWFDELLYANGMTDFFNNRPSEYAKNNQSFGEDDLF